MQIPFTLRLAYHSLRAVIRAGLLFFCAWVLLVPANAVEQRALGAAEGTQYPFGLRMMRSAQIVVAIAPARAYDAVALAAGPDVSPLLVRIALIQMAAGQVLPQSARRIPPQRSDREITGPRFIQVD